VLGVIWLVLAAAPAAAQSAAQGGPIRLFPDLGGAPPAGQPAAPPGQTGAPGVQTGTGASPPRGFQVEGLAPPGIDAIGLAGSAEGGFDADLWAGSDGELVLALLTDLPVVSTNPPLRELTRRLLMTGAPLANLGDPGSVLAARAERLLATGDLDGASALLARVPATGSDSELARLVVEAALLAGDDETACRRTADIAPTSDAAFWAKANVCCRLADGDRDGARLGLDLLREGGQTDDAAFFDLAEAIADGEASAMPAVPVEPSALHVALLRFAGLALPPTALRTASPMLLGAAVREPSLVAGDGLAVAEQAFLAGALSAEGLAARYGEQSFDSNEDALDRIETAWSPDTRALAYQAVLEQSSPATSAELLDALWRAARGSERFLIAEVFAAQFATLPVERSLVWAAPSSARALLAAERPIPASRWFSLLSTDAGNDEARDGVVRLVPLFALAGFGGSDAVPEFDQAAMTSWRLATQGADAKAGHLLALLDGIGAAVPASSWHQLILLPAQAPTAAPPVAFWHGLESASAEGRLGETVLFALHMLGGQPEAAHPEALAASLRALRSVGLNQEARAIAIATALTMGL
jgi:hypothetical protein